jgi:ribosomal protein L31E
MTVDNQDTERKDRAPDIAGEERQTLARHRLAQKLGIDPRLAEYLLELRERIEKLEDRQGSS